VPVADVELANDRSRGIPPSELTSTRACFFLAGL
jgi:hypothetical protein